MAHYKIAVLPGDGIGPEVIKGALDVLEAVGKKFSIQFEFKHALIGGCAVDATGKPLPQETLDICKNADAVLMGAVGGYKWDTLPPDKRPEVGLLEIRKGLGVYANLRPAIVWSALRDASPLRSDILGEGLDILIVRELTGGIYFGNHGRVTDCDGNLAAYDTEYYSVPEIKRIVRMGFEAARKRRGKLTSVDKANILESSRLWREQVNQMAKDYPDVAVNHLYVDNASMQLVCNPHQFDVIVTTNMFGDILSDEASMLTGSIGMLPSASLGDSGNGLYEPVHGTAPDIAGKDIANPLAAILTAAMLLRYSLSMPDAADAIESAVARALNSGARTSDIARTGEKAIGTKAMSALIVENLLKT